MASAIAIRHLKASQQNQNCQAAGSYSTSTVKRYRVSVAIAITTPRTYRAALS